MNIQVLHVKGGRNVGLEACFNRSEEKGRVAAVDT